MDRDKNILREAEQLIYGDRAETYGSALKNHELIAEFWSTILRINVTAEQVPLCMIAVKIARHMHKEKRDNLIDIAGYVGVLEKMTIEKINHIKGEAQ